MEIKYSTPCHGRMLSERERKDGVQEGRLADDVSVKGATFELL